MFVRFDLLSNLHDQKEYDNYFVICREANMLATLENNEIIYSLVNPCGKNKHIYPINKKKEKRNRGDQQRGNHHTKGYKRIINYIQMTCILNMVKKQYN